MEAQQFAKGPTVVSTDAFISTVAGNYVVKDNGHHIFDGLHSFPQCAGQLVELSAALKVLGFTCLTKGTEPVSFVCLSRYPSLMLSLLCLLLVRPKSALSLWLLIGSLNDEDSALSG